MRIEAGLSQVRRQYDKSPKAQKIIGEKHLSPEKRLRKIPGKSHSFSNTLASVMLGNQSNKATDASLPQRNPKAVKAHSTREAAPTGVGSNAS